MQGWQPFITWLIHTLPYIICDDIHVVVAVSAAAQKLVKLPHDQGGGGIGWLAAGDIADSLSSECP